VNKERIIPMPYTDSHGRPELVAGDWVKRGTAVPRTSPPGSAAAGKKHQNAEAGDVATDHRPLSS